MFTRRASEPASKDGRIVYMDQDDLKQLQFLQTCFVRGDIDMTARLQLILMALWLLFHLSRKKQFHCCCCFHKSLVTFKLSVSITLQCLQYSTVQCIFYSTALFTVALVSAHPTKIKPLTFFIKNNLCLLILFSQC